MVLRALFLAGAVCCLGPIVAAAAMVPAIGQPGFRPGFARDDVDAATRLSRHVATYLPLLRRDGFSFSPAPENPAPPAAETPFGAGVVADNSKNVDSPDTEPQPSVMTEFQSDEISAALIAKLTALDATRIKRFDESRKAARREAGDGDAKLLPILAELMDAQPQGIELKTTLGKWRCRRFNLGGEFFKLSVNPYFNCKISRQGDDYVFEKTSGSQLMLGKLERVDEHRLIYYGAYYSGPPKPVYPPTDSYHDEVGFLFRLGPDRLRLELPLPTAYASSHHDVIELTR